MSTGNGAAGATLWAPAAWIDGRWHEAVRLQADDAGRWARVDAGTPAPADAHVLRGPVLPGLVDAHSHAFQRAFAGLAERREGEDDDFWSWRDRMYRVANAIDADALRAIAAHLYVELLRGGYTQVCEFHYLQHAASGAPHDDPLEMAFALADAAEQAGIGLTWMPALYERAGFAHPALRADQRRFHADAADVWHLAGRFAAEAPRGRRAPMGAGLAIHSLRAARAESLSHLARLADGHAGPIHIHVAEQRAELRDCIAATGTTPVDWLAREGLLDARWQLVHATHAAPAEIDAVARAGAGVVLCPGTEANLGDGLTDLPGWLAAGVPLALGSDSQVTRGWREELRWLEYGQRLRLERRNVAARPAAPGAGGAAQADTAGRLFELALAGGARAAGLPPGGLRPGARADLLVIDPEDASLAGLPRARWLDALVFSSPGRPWRDVMVAGRWVVQDHRHAASGPIAARFAAVMGTLWPASDA